ncbi:MAG: hypothetical protein ACE5JG_11130 [Planctomycetota bacterium]
MDSVVSATREPYWGFTLSGLLLLGVMFFMERARSLALHTGGRLLRVVVALHLIASLYASAAHNGTWGDVTVFLAVAGGLLVLGRWRSHQVFFIAGLAGLVLGCYLVLDLGLVGAVGFPVVLAIGGLLATLGTYARLHKGRPAG